MKKLFASLIFAALIAALTVVSASAATTEAFTITDYDVTVNISESNVYDVTEVITVNFTELRHGIFRYIPYKGTWLRDAEDGGNTDYTAKITNVDVDGHNYSVSKSGGYTTIQIGDADEYVSGTQVYRISYSIHFYDDGLPETDEVYYNLIGTDWGTTIDHVSFSVTLPKNFDPDTLGFSVGYYGDAGYNPSSLTYRINGNTITGELNEQLTSYQGVTMRMELPQGYFDIPFQGAIDNALLVSIAALILLAFVLFMLYGRDSKLVKTVEFYAPDGMTPSEVGYIIDGVVDNRDVVSLIIYWAHRGYLTIEDTGGSSFKLHKIQDIDSDAKRFEKHMFKKLFKSGQLVESSDLRNTFYTTVDSTKKKIKESFDNDKRRVFTESSVKLRPVLTFLTILPVVVTLFLSYYRSDPDFIIALLVSAGLGIFILWPVSAVVNTIRQWRGKGPLIRVIKLVFGLFISLLALMIFLLMTIDMVYVPALPWFAVLATIIIGVFASFIDKRTPIGVLWMGQILGFREFLKTAEHDKLVALVEGDPEYFYNILPYAWVLNVSDKWAKKFETIAVQPPTWYYGHTGMFYPVVFMNHLNHSMNVMQSSMASRPSSSGSGSGGSGFSGGGFSGGGGGGGGGGSW